MDTLHFHDLCKKYNDVNIIENATYSLKEGEVVALVAPSGTGKSTLLQMLGLLDTPTSGDIILHGKSTKNLSFDEKAYLRSKHIGFVYQSHHLLPEFTSLENVMLPQLILGVTNKKAKERSRYLLDLVGLTSRSDHRPNQLSGGEQQRVAFARAIVNSPTLLFADEPTGNLDIRTGEKVFDELIKIVKETKLSCLIATHNQELAKKMDKIITLENQSTEDGSFKGASIKELSL